MARTRSEVVETAVHGSLPLAAFDRRLRVVVPSRRVKTKQPFLRKQHPFLLPSASLRLTLLHYLAGFTVARVTAPL